MDQSEAAVEGLVRPNNEDSFAALPELGLFMVADGMGGRPGREVASRLAIDTVRACFEREDPEESWPYARDPSKEREEVMVAEAVRRANATVLQQGLRTPSLRDMGTTFAGALFRGIRLYVAVGTDARVEVETTIWARLASEMAVLARKLRRGHRRL